MASNTTKSNVSKYIETYTTFSGADIVCSFNNIAVGSLQGISWSVTREKAPIYTMGSPNPRSFSRGKRGIAGSLIFTTFDRPALYRLLARGFEDGTMKIWTRTHNIVPNSTRAAAISPADDQTTEVKSIMPYYADQIPPFDVTITFANEYGQAATRAIYGVELLNEGSGASMDDIVIEETMTYVAREIGPMYSTNVEFSPDGNTDLNVIGLGQAGD